MIFRRSHVLLAGLIASVSPCTSTFACGPFFPETVLDQSKATLRPPIVNFEAEVRKLQPPSQPPAVARPTNGLSTESPYRYRSLEGEILGPEVKELEEALQGLPDDRRRQVVCDYRALRAAMLLKYWSEHFATYDLSVPPNGYDLLAQAQLGHWPDGLPEDISLYLQGALQYDYGDKNGAVETWRQLLALPPDRRRNRSVAAAWMIAKVTREGDGLAAAQPWYAMCAKLAAEGFRDSLQLGLASLGWEARYQLDQGDRRKALELYYHQAMAGNPGAWDSLLRALPDLDKLSGEQLVAWARDPFLRGMLTAELLRDSFFWDGNFRDDSTPDDRGVSRWLDAIERTKIDVVDEASKFGELAYSSGHFDQAKRWLKRAPANDPRALWLRGKLALMEGDTKTAERVLLAARAGFPREMEAQNATIMMDGPACALPAETAATYRTSQFYGDLGAANLARDHYTQALSALSKGAFFEDAAYVAERVLSAEELLSYVRRNFTAPTGQFLNLQYHPNEGSTNRTIRYLLARRLAREHYFKDARPFYPGELLPVFDRYVTLLRKGRSSAPRAERAGALWEAAQIHRVLGMELFGEEGEPDATNVDGMFPPTSFIKRRLGFSFAKIPFDWWNDDQPIDIVPSATVDERARVKQSKLPHEERFQYRYAAADLAWKAAGLMANHSEETARVLGIAGTWIENRDPKAADRFYKAMIWRNWSTPLAREADVRRWFPEIAWTYDPWAAANVPTPEGF